ncbi:ROK family protein [Melioribacteraceae bacterium 4301-Me]|uniref:ROK family protein n=1 Tax=Pyranulibacter aquaticus TaxID=3163344 RepID=UPI003597C068
MSFIGVDLGGTKISAALFNPEGEIIQKETLKLEGQKGNEVGLLIQRAINKFYVKNDVEKIEAVGICVPGIYYPHTGRVWAPNIPGWENYPLLDQIKSALLNKNTVVSIDSDRACYILGETWKGSAQGCKDAIFIAVGTGIGAGIMVNGEILRGSHDIAGAIGWLALDKPFRKEYIDCGCFEYHASGEGIAKVAKEYLLQEKNYSGILRQIPIEEITAREIFESYKTNDPISVKVINEAIEYWGMTAANLVSLFNPEKIIFGGGVFGPALQLLDKIVFEARKWAQPISINQVEFCGSSLSGDAGLYGAGFLALNSLSPKRENNV